MFEPGGNNPTDQDPIGQASYLGRDSTNANSKPVVVGIYGIPGCGKSTMLGQLKQELPEGGYTYFEGSEVIASFTGGLEIFKQSGADDQLKIRQAAIDLIGQMCKDSGTVGIVAGHFMFWDDEENEVGQPVYTQNDLEMFTHILYLDVPANVIAQRRKRDAERSRAEISVAHLQKWQDTEVTQLRRLCRENGILFSVVSHDQPYSTAKVSTMLRDFAIHAEKHNLSCAKARLDDILASSSGASVVEKALVMDADKTLSMGDTGVLFWNVAGYHGHMGMEEGRDPLKTLFSSHLGYSYTAFRQATLLYEEAASDDHFESICEDVAAAVSMYSEFVSLLKLVAREEHVTAVVVTCGLRRVWEKVLKKEGLSNKVKVIGGGRLSDGFVVTPDIKAAIVSCLRYTHGMHVWAIGDSVLDLPMLKEANEAIVVVGDEQRRSKSMEPALLTAIETGNLQARQILLPSTVPPMLDLTRLPVMDLMDSAFVNSVLARKRPCSRNVFHTTERNAAKILMAPTRDAKVAGPALRKAHAAVGRYLATEVITDPGVIGLEEYPIPHVQGHQTKGHRLCYENQTLIIALMRGGEPLALGINDAFPRAMFVHAKHATDVTPAHLADKRNVLLVDSVVNSGKSVVEFINHIRILNSSILVVVAAGVVQARAVSSGVFAQKLEQDSNLRLVALRLSDNKFTGRGTTDTGNRLFNTTHLD